MRSFWQVWQPQCARMWLLMKRACVDAGPFDYWPHKAHETAAEEKIRKDDQHKQACFRSQGFAAGRRKT